MDEVSKPEHILSIPISKESEAWAGAIHERAFQGYIAKIIRQSGLFLIGSVFTMVAGYLLKIYTARVLGADGLGLYALGMSIIAFFAIFSTLGIPRAMVKFVSAFIAKGQYQRLGVLVIRGGILVAFVSLLLCFLLYFCGEFIAVRIFNKPDLTPVIALVCFMIPIGNISFFFSQIIAGLKKPGTAKNFSSFLSYPVLIGFTVWFFHKGWGLKGYIWANLISTAAVVIALGMLAIKYLPIRLDNSSAILQPLGSDVRSFSLSMIGINAVQFASNRTDQLIIGAFLAASSLGIYSVALTVTGFLSIFLTILNPIFSPIISELYTKNETQLLNQLYQAVTKWTLALSLPIFCFIIVYSKEIMCIFGSEFEAGWPIVSIISIGQLVNVGVGSVGYMLLMTGYERLYVRIQSGCAVVMLLLYFILVPYLQLIGAAICYCAGQIALNFFFLLVVKKNLKLWPYNRSFCFLVVLFGIILSGIIFLRLTVLQNMGNIGGLLLALICAYALFILAILAFGWWSKDRELFKMLHEK